MGLFDRLLKSLDQMFLYWGDHTPRHPHGRPLPPQLYWGLDLKIIQNVDKGCWVPNTSAFSCWTPHTLIPNTRLGLQGQGYDTATMQLFSFLQGRQHKCGHNFISSRAASRIQHNIKFLACLFNLRNCKNDDRWHTELTYVLYSLLKKGVHRNFDQDRSYSMRVAIKIIWWLFGQLGSEHSGFLFETFFKTNQHCCWSTLVITALTFSTLPVPIRTWWMCH